MPAPVQNIAPSQTSTNSAGAPSNGGSMSSNGLMGLASANAQTAEQANGSGEALPPSRFELPPSPSEADANQPETQSSGVSPAALGTQGSDLDGSALDGSGLDASEHTGSGTDTSLNESIAASLEGDAAKQLAELDSMLDVETAAALASEQKASLNLQTQWDGVAAPLQRVETDVRGVDALIAQAQTEQPPLLAETQETSQLTDEAAAYLAMLDEELTASSAAGLAHAQANTKNDGGLIDANAPLPSGLVADELHADGRPLPLVGGETSITMHQPIGSTVVNTAEQSPDVPPVLTPLQKGEAEALNAQLKSNKASVNSERLEAANQSAEIANEGRENSDLMIDSDVGSLLEGEQAAILGDAEDVADNVTLAAASTQQASGRIGGEATLPSQSSPTPNAGPRHDSPTPVPSNAALASAAESVEDASIEATKLSDSTAKLADVVQQAANQQTARTPASQVASAMTLAGQGKMGSNEWAQGLSQRVMLVTGQNNQFAEIQLDPPELGALRVKVQITQEGVNVNFSSAHASVRDAVEQSIPRLREMMAEQGLSLGESSVSDEQQEQAYASQDDLNGGAGNGSNDGAEAEEEMSLESMISNGQATGLVDYYA